MITPPPPIRVTPATSTVHLDFNANEDVDVQLDVTDADGNPVPLASAVAVVAPYSGGPALHTWSAAAGNLTILPGDAPGISSRVQLRSSRVDTAAWYAAWSDAEWQLEVVDVFGQQKRPCEGEVRVRPSRGGGS